MGHMFGTPKKCLNRICGQAFYKENNKGYLPKTESEVYVVMKCSKCGDTFAIPQNIAMVSDYIKKLPNKPIEKRDKTPITITEHDGIRNTMEKENVLVSLKESYNRKEE